MIVFLTLIYVVLPFLAVKIGIIKLNSLWKISPVLWMVLLFFVLFVPMQWGAPAGATKLAKDYGLPVEAIGYSDFIADGKWEIHDVMRLDYEEASRALGRKSKYPEKLDQ